MSFTEQLTTVFARHTEFLDAIEQRSEELDLATQQLLNGFKDNAITMLIRQPAFSLYFKLVVMVGKKLQLFRQCKIEN